MPARSVEQRFNLAPGMRVWVVYAESGETIGYVKAYDKGYARTIAKRFSRFGAPTLVEVTTAQTIGAALRQLEDLDPPRRRNSKNRPRRSARVAGARKATRRRRNPSPKGGARETFELAHFQGYAVEVAYRRELDGKLYSHQVETDAAELYLAKHPVFGHCVIIVDPSGRTPLWK